MQSITFSAKLVVVVMVGVILSLVLFVYFALPWIAPIVTARYSPFLEKVMETQLRCAKQPEGEAVLGAVLERIKGRDGPIIISKMIENYRVGDVESKRRVVRELLRVAGDSMEVRGTEMLLLFFREVVNSSVEESSAEACLALAIMGDEASFDVVAKRGANYANLEARKDWLRSLKYFKHSGALELLLMECNSSEKVLQEKAREGIAYKYGTTGIHGVD